MDAANAAGGLGRWGTRLLCGKGWTVHPPRRSSKLGRCKAASGPGFQVEIPKTFRVVPSSLGQLCLSRAPCSTPWRGMLRVRRGGLGAGGAAAAVAGHGRSILRVEAFGVEVQCFFCFFTLVTGPRRSLSLNVQDLGCGRCGRHLSCPATLQWLAFKPRSCE